MLRVRTYTPFFAVFAAAALALHCGSNRAEGDPPVFPPEVDAAPPPATDAAPPPSFADASSTFSDFPATPSVDPSLPGDIGTQFGAASPGNDAGPGTGDGGPAGAPCVTEPPTDAMVPRNWTPLFVEWNAEAAQTVTEVRLTVDNQVNPYVAYVPGRTFTFPSALWSSVAFHTSGRDIAISVRTAELKDGKIVGAPSSAARSVVHVAPVDAPGSVVYWSSSPATSFKGFAIGDTTSKTVLTPQTAGATSTGGQTECISCHSSSIDGKLIFYTPRRQRRVPRHRRPQGGEPHPARSG